MSSSGEWRIAGEVPFRWSVQPRFGYAVGARACRLGVAVASARSDAMAICSWGAGERPEGPDSTGGRFSASDGSQTLVVLSAAHGEPLILPSRREVEARLAATVDFWRGWAAERRYEGPWRGGGAERARARS